jgi:hypothetical protein
VVLCAGAIHSPTACNGWPALCARPEVAGLADAITSGDTALTMPDAAALPDDALDALMRQVPATSSTPPTPAA